MPTHMATCMPTHMSTYMPMQVIILHVHIHAHTGHHSPCLHTCPCRSSFSGHGWRHGRFSSGRTHGRASVCEPGESLRGAARRSGRRWRRALSPAAAQPSPLPTALPPQHPPSPLSAVPVRLCRLGRAWVQGTGDRCRLGRAWDSRYQCVRHLPSSRPLRSSAGREVREIREIREMQEMQEMQEMRVDGIYDAPRVPRTAPCPRAPEALKSSRAQASRVQASQVKSTRGETPRRHEPRQGPRLHTMEPSIHTSVILPTTHMYMCTMYMHTWRPRVPSSSTRGGERCAS